MPFTIHGMRNCRQSESRNCRQSVESQNNRTGSLFNQTISFKILLTNPFVRTKGFDGPQDSITAIVPYRIRSAEHREYRASYYRSATNQTAE